MSLTITIKGRDQFSAVAKAVQDSAARLQGSLGQLGQLQGIEASAGPLGKLADSLGRASEAASTFSNGADNLKGVSRRFTSLANGLGKLDKAAQALEARSSLFSKMADDLAKIGDGAEKVRRAEKALLALAKVADKLSEALAGAEEKTDDLGESPGLTRWEKGADRLGGVADRLSKKFGTVGKKSTGLGKRISENVKKLKEATGAFDEMRNAVDEVGDTLQAVLGRRGRQIADAIEDNIEDPFERAERAAAELERQLEKTPNALDKANAGFGRLKAEVGIFVGNLGPVGAIAGATFAAVGVAAVAAAVKLGGALVDAFKDVTAAAIENSQTLKDAADNATSAWDNFRVSIGNALLGGVQQGEGAINGFAAVLDRLSVVVEENAGLIRGAFVTAIKLSNATINSFKPQVIATAFAFSVLADSVVAPIRAVQAFNNALKNGESTMDALRKAAESGFSSGFTAEILDVTKGFFNLKDQIADAATGEGKAVDNQRKSYEKLNKEIERKTELQTLSSVGDVAGADSKQLEGIARQAQAEIDIRKQKIAQLEEAEGKARDKEFERHRRHGERLVEEQEALGQRLVAAGAYAQQARAEEAFFERQKKGREAAKKRLAELRREAKEGARQDAQLNQEVEGQTSQQIKSRIDGLERLAQAQQAQADQFSRLAGENKGFASVLQEDAKVAQTLADQYKKVAQELQGQFDTVKAQEEAEKTEKARVKTLERLGSKLRAQAKAEAEISKLVRESKPADIQGKLKSLRDELEIQQKVRDQLQQRLALEVLLQGVGSKGFAALSAQLVQVNTGLQEGEDNVTRLQGALSNIDPFQQFKDGFERATQASETFWDAFGEGAGSATKQSVGGLFSAIGDGFASLFNGGDTSFIDFTKKLVGQQASIWGDFFIAQGAALFFTNPVQGIGLGFAGATLKGLAATLGSSSSSPSSRSSSGGSSSVSASASRFPDLARNDSETTEPAPVYLVMDNDRAFRGYFTDQQNDDARRGRTSVRL